MKLTVAFSNRSAKEPAKSDIPPQLSPMIHKLRRQKYFQVLAQPAIEYVRTDILRNVKYNKQPAHQPTDDVQVSTYILTQPVLHIIITRPARVPPLSSTYPESKNAPRFTEMYLK
jgi:hypothetical protein